MNIEEFSNESENIEDTDVTENISDNEIKTGISDEILNVDSNFGVVGFVVKTGICGTRLIKGFFGFVVKLLLLGLKAGLHLFKNIFIGFKKLISYIFRPFKRKMNFTEELGRSIKKAKKEGKRKYITELIKSIIKYLFSDEGVIYTSFNYILPIVSVAFLIGIIRYGTGLEYGISVEYNGKEIGVISAESEFDEAAREVQKRISYVEDSKYVEFSPKFSLKIISEQEEFVSSEQLANKMLSESDQELTEAYGIYVDDEFVGAVKNKEDVANALTEVLINYKVDGDVRDMKFSKEVEYVEGIYLTESVITEKDAISMLTAKKSVTGSYVVQSGDSWLSISQKYNMTEEQIKKLNPKVSDKLTAGRIVKVLETESFLPIQYIRELETVSFIDYETVEVETSSLNVGTTALLLKGERGEKHNKVEVTYVDGIERARNVLSSKITKQPVVEQIGIGTYTAKPADGSIFTGSGQFGWPVDGGFVSDPFISDRNHKGLDIAAPENTDIYAASDGVVIAAGWNTGGYGYFVMIDHLDGYETLYGHCNGLYVTKGQIVTRGQLIAAVGNTGDSTGNHCHFEVRYNGNYYDPLAFINTTGEAEKKTDRE